MATDTSHRTFDMGNGLTIEYREEYHSGGEIRLLNKTSGLQIVFPTSPLELVVDEEAMAVTFLAPQVSSISFRVTDDFRCADAADSMGRLPIEYFFAALAGKFSPI